MLIKDPEVRASRAVEKQQLLLDWLANEMWSTVPVVADLLSVSRQSAWKTLKQLQVRGFARSSHIPLVGKSSLTIWGLTPHGAAFADSGDITIPGLSVFEPSRVSLSMMPHHINLQKARIKAERAGWNHWVRGERLGYRVKNRPDAVVVSALGEKIAVELERTIKTRKRYQQIMAAHLQQIKSGHWDRVDYVCPDDDMTPRLERVFRSIDYVLVDGSRVSVTDRHHARFSFTSLDVWPQEVEE